MTHKRMRELGWTRVDARPWRSKLGARWTHTLGFTLAHCGHPTALHPWLLFDADGRAIKRANGRVFDTLAQASQWVAAELVGVQWPIPPATRRARRVGAGELATGERYIVIVE